MKFLEWVDIKNKLHLTKIGETMMRVSPQTDPPKFKLFTFLS